MNLALVLLVILIALYSCGPCGRVSPGPDNQGSSSSSGGMDGGQDGEPIPVCENDRGLS